MQDDVLPGTATVREYMVFHDTLRGAHRHARTQPATPRDRYANGAVPRRRATTAAVAEARQMHRVTALLQDLGLLKSQDTLIGDAFTRGISGGEKRRLSVAVELLAAPQLLFLDEPTTGTQPAAAHPRTPCMHALLPTVTRHCHTSHPPRLQGGHRPLLHVLHVRVPGNRHCIGVHRR